MESLWFFFSIFQLSILFLLYFVKHEVQLVYDVIIFIQAKGNRAVETIEMNNNSLLASSSSLIHYISPHKVYYFAEQQDSIFVRNADSVEIGWLDYKFSWPRSDLCHAHFACTALDFNICGTYGWIIDDQSGRNQSACLENVLYEWDMSPDNEVSHLYLWHLAGKAYKAECYFWCTIDGQLPDEKPDGTVDKDTLQKLVTICHRRFLIRKNYLSLSYLS